MALCWRCAVRGSLELHFFWPGMQQGRRPELQPHGSRHEMGVTGRRWRVNELSWVAEKVGKLASIKILLEYRWTSNGKKTRKNSINWWKGWRLVFEIEEVPNSYKTWITKNFFQAKQIFLHFVFSVLGEWGKNLYFVFFQGPLHSKLWKILIDGNSVNFNIRIISQRHLKKKNYEMFITKIMTIQKYGWKHSIPADFF